LEYESGYGDYTEERMRKFNDKRLFYSTTIEKLRVENPD
jgi:hypothetical protein